MAIAPRQKKTMIKDKQFYPVSTGVEIYVGILDNASDENASDDNASDDIASDGKMQVMKMRNV